MDASSVIALIALVISVPSAAVTFIYSHKQTAAAVKANALTERAQREQAEPYVIADIRPRVPGSSLLVFVIENTGPTLARNVQLQVDPPLQSSLGEERSGILNQVAARPISVLPPGRALSFVMDVGHQMFSSDLPRVYTVTVRAAGPFGPVEPLTYVIDLNMLSESLLDRESVEWSTHVLAEQSKKSVRALEKQANNMASLARKVSEALDARRSPSEEETGPA